MIKDLTKVCELQGEFVWTEAAKNALTAWREKDYEPVPTHPKMHYYNTRRWSHVMKLAMINAIESRLELRVRVDDIQRGIDDLIEVEAVWPNLYAQAASTRHDVYIDELWLYLAKHYGKSQEPILEKKAWMFLRDYVESWRHKGIIDYMAGIAMIKFTGNIDIPGFRQIIPMERMYHGGKEC